MCWYTCGTMTTYQHILIISDNFEIVFRWALFGPKTAMEIKRSCTIWWFSETWFFLNTPRPSLQLWDEIICRTNCNCLVFHLEFSVYRSFKHTIGWINFWIKLSSLIHRSIEIPAFFMFSFIPPTISLETIRQFTS